MTTKEAFFEAFVNLPHVVLGRRLQPLSIFHLIWLYQVESPLVLTHKEARLEDLELAVVICGSKTNAEVLRGLQSKEQTRWKRTLNFFWRRDNRRKRVFKDELLKFLAYNDDFLALPKFYDSKDETTNETLPWLLLHATSLIKATGWDEEKVFKMPIGKVLWYNLANGFLETGKTRIISDTDQEAMDALRARKALTAKGL